MKDKRFRLSISHPHESYEIIDNVESEEKNALCIYNDLGCWSFSSAPALCDLLNKLDEENNELKDKYEVCNEAYLQVKEDAIKKRDEIVQLKKEDELFFKQVFDILLKYQDLFNREMSDEVLEELGIELTRWFE